ncbi:MAG: hypothetical protein H0T60_05175 [Acidobacteria bacterium]|nr:hypothetical protein [Acidobacteriota bacterium]
MEQWFTYEMRDDDIIVRIGKGHSFSKSSDAVIGYLRSRYGSEGWTHADITWHFSESAALKREKRAIDEHLSIYGELPLWNRARGGGGRQVYVKCKAYTTYGQACGNDSLAGNYNFCGIHRR